MKKIICLFCAVICVFSLVSCAYDNTATKNPVDTTSAVDIPETEKTEDVFFYPKTCPFAETPTRVLYSSNGTLYYYNKITGDGGIFCFDPLCQHNSPITCIAHKFRMLGIFQTVVYCEVDQRFYALRGEQFCSFAFDGSDLRVEHSFGEDGKFDDSPLGVYPYGGLYDIQVSGKFVFFIARHGSTGKRMLMRYDVNNKTLETLFYDENTNINGYLAGKDTLYLSLADRYNGVYQTDFSGKKLEKVSDVMIQNFGSTGIFDGEQYFYVKTGEREDHGRYPICIASLSMKTGETQDVLPLDETTHDGFVLAVTDKNIYYALRDKALVGHRESSMGTYDIINECSKIYSFNRKDGTVMTVLDDIRCDTQNICFIHQDVIIFGNVCFPDEKNATHDAGCFVARIDDEGIFRDLKILHTTRG